MDRLAKKLQATMEALKGTIRLQLYGREDDMKFLVTVSMQTLEVRVEQSLPCLRRQ